MFSQSTELYDFIYSEFKDFEAEASQVATLLKEKCPSAKRLLDVGCGTGRHAAALVSKHGFEVDGLDIESGFLEIARERCPNGKFFRGDMASFDLGLFTEEEMLEALQLGGFHDVEFDRAGLTGRGLYLARTPL